MENTPITLENVLDQAANWTFAGDFTLLQWMNKISQDLESKANKTTEALSKLDNNVRSTNIALDNVANSLTTLQFGNQFVESRVQDDETLPNTNEAITSKETNNNEETPSSKAMLNTFLDNNLKILRNCHEKYSIDLDDSDDDEEGANEKTCIYQPINPYNERPLPFIFGSKDWYAKWHVGLFENQQDNNYSGDEISETFSESSNTPTDDNESFESNTEWTSSNSVDNNNYDINIKVRNATSLKDSELLGPGTPSKAINVKKTNITTSESSSVSTASSSLAKKPLDITKPNEIKATRSNSINSISTNVSNRDSIKTVGLSKEKPLAYSRPAAPFVDLFAEPPEDIQSIASTISSTQHTRRPSADFTTRIPDALAKSANADRPSLFSTSKPPPFVDLFSEPPEDVNSTTSSTVSSKVNIKRKPLNLFDSDNEDDLLTRPMDNENLANTKKTSDLIAPLNQEKETEKSKTTEPGFIKPKTIVKDKPLNVSTIPKSLFDEDSDEDDDDFLKAFAKKSTLTKSPLTNTILFDKDYDLVSESPKKLLHTNLFDQDLNDSNKVSMIKETKTKRINIFDDIEDDEDENSLFGNINKNKSTNDSKGFEELEKKMGKSPHNNNKENMFDDPKEFEKKEVEIIDKFKAPAKKKINLFDDLEDDDNDDDIFAAKPLKLDLKIKQATLKQDQDVNSVIEVNDSKNKNNPLEILKKPNGKTLKDLNVKELPINEKTNDMNFLKTKLKSLEDISDSFKEEEATNFKTDFEPAILENITESKSVIKPDKVLDITKDQTGKSLQNILETDNKIESLPKPQISMNKPSKESLKDNTNDKLKEPNNTITATDSQTKPENESTTSNINDLSINKAPAILENDSPSTAKDMDLSAAPTKYDFNSIIFLDEPPEDDSEFFETLNKTPKTLNTKFNTIDLEHDLYEPELPKVPATNVTIKPVESVETRQPLLFSGLQLFSDVPPDDDNDDDNDNTNKVIADNSLTKRLHSVFYDDVNETLAALNKNQIESISSQTVLPKQQPSLLKETNADISKDVVDHNLAQAKEQNIETETTDSKSSLINSNKKRPVSKLLMPNININVQALLPGANTTLRKAKEDSKEITEPETTATVSNRNQTLKSNEKEMSTKTETLQERTAETEHILPNVTKNRVRAPLNRRPSTRKARQDNYRQSLMEDDFQISPTSNVAIDKSNVEKLNEKARNIEQIFDKNHEEIFKKVKTPTKSNISKSSRLNVETDSKQTIEVSSKAMSTNDKPKPSTSILFDDELEEDSKPLSTKQASKDIVSTKSFEKAFKEKTITSLLFDDDDEKKDNSYRSQDAHDLNKNKVQTESLGKSFEDQMKRKPTSSLLFDDDEEDTFDIFKNTKTSKSMDNKGAIKNEDKSFPPTSLKEKNVNIEKLVKPKGSVIFDDENEEDEDDFFKRLNNNDTKKVTTKTLLEEKQIKPEKSLLFDKEAKDESSISTQVVEKHATVSLANVTSSISTVLPANLSLENQKEKTNPKLDTNNEQKEKTIPKLDSNNEQIKQTKNSVNFLDDDDCDDDTLFGPTKVTKSSAIKPIKTTSDNTKKTSHTNDFVQTQIQTSSFKTMDSSKGKDKFISFLDNDSDDDFTVAGLQTKKSSQTTKPAPAATTSTKSTLQHKAQKSNSSKLFADSDTDSDDLFGKISPKNTLNKPIQTTKISTTNQAHLLPKGLTASKPQASLFSDDSDEGHDLPKPPGSVTKKVTPKSSTKENSSKVSAQSNASLFSDLDSDEDDLFGGAGISKPTTASIISNVKTATATSPPVAKTMLQTSKAKTSADNPLADLL